MGFKKFFMDKLEYFVEDVLPEWEKKAAKKIADTERNYDRYKDASVDKLKQDYNSNWTSKEAKTAIKMVVRDRKEMQEAERKKHKYEM